MATTPRPWPTPARTVLPASGDSLARAGRRARVGRSRCSRDDGGRLLAPGPALPRASQGALLIHCKGIARVSGGFGVEIPGSWGRRCIFRGLRHGEGRFGFNGGGNRARVGGVSLTALAAGGSGRGLASRAGWSLRHGGGISRPLSCGRARSGRRRGPDRRLRTSRSVVRF